MQLNLEQKKLIRSSAMGHSIIRGVAGSGKTTVAVHRISFLLDNYCYGASDKILMVTYNKSLTNYIEYIYGQIDKDDQYGLFDKTELQKNVKITNIDKLLYSYFRAFCQEKGKLLQIVQGQKEIEIWQKSLSNVKRHSGMSNSGCKVFRIFEKKLHGLRLVIMWNMKVISRLTGLEEWEAKEAMRDHGNYRKTAGSDRRFMN